MSLELICATLRERGFRLTPQRKELLVVVERRQRPLAIDEIAMSLDLRETDLPTLYRNLSFLEGQKILKTIHFKDGKVRYELSDRYRDHHHHFVCEDCGSVEDVEVCLPASWFAKLKSQGLAVTDHSLELYGLCQECSE